MSKKHPIHQKIKHLEELGESLIEEGTYLLEMATTLSALIQIEEDQVS